MRRPVGGVVAIVASVLVGCVLGLYGTSAAQSGVKPTIRPFADSQGKRVDTVDQLRQIVSELKKQNELLKEQNKQIAELNALLKSGKLKVVVDR